MKAFVIMLMRRLDTADALRPCLDHDDAGAAPLRPLLDAHGGLPARRTWERRLGLRPPSLPGVIGGGGRHVVALLHPWATHGRAVAVDSIPLATGGGGWPNKPRAQGLIPHSAMDTEAGWRKSGWHGWWYGWKWPLAVTAGAVWSRLAAARTVANRGDHAVAPWWLRQLPGAVRSGLAETQDNDSDLRQPCHRRGCELVATRRGPSPQRDGGVEVRNVFHPLRSHAIAPFNGWYTHILAWRVKMPVKGLPRSPLLALGAVLVDQLVWRDQHAQHRPRGQGIKPLLRAA